MASVELRSSERNMLEVALVQTLAGRNLTISSVTRGSRFGVADSLVKKGQFVRVNRRRDIHGTGSRCLTATYRLTDVGRLRAIRIALKRLAKAPT